MLRLVKTFRFEGTRTMALSAYGEPQQATMPCHVTVFLTAPSGSQAESLKQFVEVCGKISCFLKTTFHGKILDEGVFLPPADAAKIADFLIENVLPRILDGSILDLEKVKVMFGVIEQAQATPKEKATLLIAWEESNADTTHASNHLEHGL